MRYRTIFSLILAMVMMGTSRGEEPVQPPNIILMMADDLGWGDLKSFRPESPIHTPHLDEMAASGITFDRFYAAAPVCSPTRGSCLTGRHPFRYGIYFANTGQLKTEELTLAELLQKQGYKTGHFGKWHLGTLTTTEKDANRGGPKSTEVYSPPWENGFDTCFSTESKVPTWDPMRKPKTGPTKIGWDSLGADEEDAPYGTYYWNERGEKVTDNLDGDDSRVLMDRAVPFVKQAAGEKKPFFAVIWFHTPHLPVVAGPKYAKMYSQYDLHERNYYGCVTAMDDQIGRLRKTLADAGVTDNTMLWFCSDNGPEGNAKSPGSAGDFRGRKRSLYEGGVRVPGILQWPSQVKPGRVTSFPAVTSDYLPTILDTLSVQYAGARPLDGISLLPVLQGTQSERTEPIGFQSRNQVAWTTNRYKLFSGNGGKTLELYDLLNDPSEQNDLSSSHPEIVARLWDEFRQWQSSCQESDQGSDY
ncbi:Arylsulfatase [Allorhodopirellula solitaria]|uniref:Arylsulfatase n=1 Tax=Allorhodopirellula solitaria TaxID=2527987 RepID=A0A5C5YKI8_9BACT|nr:Arylsulfatase [Allorhodopirellula solitaria]